MCDYAPNREAAMTVIQRDAGGKPTVWCDPCIEPLVRALNAAGLETIASCCGHGKQYGRITLRSGIELLVLPDMDAVSALTTDATDGGVSRAATTPDQQAEGGDQ